MKPLLLALVTLTLTLNALGLELVKCGSVKIPEGVATNNLKDLKVIKARADGTTLFWMVDQFIVVKPFIGNTGFISGGEYHREDSSTNNWSFSTENGVTTVSFTRTVIATYTKSDANVVFSTFSENGFLESMFSTRFRSVEDVKVTGGVESRREIEYGLTRACSFYKKDLHGKVVEKISVDGDGFIPQSSSIGGMSTSYDVTKKILIPKLNGDSIDFYLVTDPDLFPDTALGAPKIEGSSATFNVTTGSEEPLEIQASDDLKIWKRLKTLEDANGRSVTVPADAAQGFIRAVER